MGLPVGVLAFSTASMNEKRSRAVPLPMTGGHHGDVYRRHYSLVDTKLHAATHAVDPEIDDHNSLVGTKLHAATRAVDPEIDNGTNPLRRELEVSRRPNPISEIDFDMPKSRERLSLARLAKRLDQELYESEWFVTGHVNPKYFHTDFYYEDADVVLNSLQEYANDVYTLFDQSCSRAEIVETKVSQERAQTITCRWRCSGRANLLWGIDIKPFMVETKFEVDKQTGLIAKQFDEYSLPRWDLLVSSFFPFLNGIVTAPPAPPVPPRRPAAVADTVPRSPFLAWASKAGFESYFMRPKRKQSDSGSPLDDMVEFYNFFSWKPPAVDLDKEKLITPEHQQQQDHALPSIRSPTLWERMEAFAPANAELVENLTEATRRTESRRSRRYYVSYVDQEEKVLEDATLAP